MAAKDYYKVLGIDRSSSEEQIKKAYKKLARQFHPDLNPNNPEAEKKFKEISEAYAVLSDTDKRAKYDRFGSGNFGDDFSKAWSQARTQGGGFDFSQMNDAGFGFNLNDLFGDLFGGGPRGARGAGSRTVQDLEMELPLTFVEAAMGAQKTISVNGALIDVKIPAGVENASKIRVSGKGQSGGDLYLVCRVSPHSFFKRSGDQIELSLPISLKEAIAGGAVAVPTLSGTVDVKIPAGSSSGQKLKLKAKGIFNPKTGKAGDQIVELQVVIPKLSDKHRKEILKALDAAIDEEHPRAHLGV